MLKKLYLLFLSLSSTAILQADNALFPCEPPPFALAPPERFASCCNFEGHIDFLYMKGKVSDGIQTDGVPLSILELSTSSNTSTPGVPIPNARNLSLKEIYVDWNGGFDIGVGWNFPSDHWSMTFDWLHYSSTSSFQLPFGTNVSSELFSYAPANFLNPYGTGYVSEYRFGKIDFEMNFNLLELCIRKTFLAGPNLSLTPKAGLLSIFIRDSVALGFFAGQPRGGPLTPILLTNREHIDGVGVLVGLSSEWNLGCGFSLYGCFDFAAVSYQAKVQEILSSTNGSFSSGEPSAHFEVDKFDPLLKYQLGCSLHLPFGFQNTCFSLSLGWEAILFFNQDHLTAYTFSEAKPLSLQGLIFSVDLSI